MIGLKSVRRALLSVTDKTGLVEFAGVLAGLGVELVSTGGTAKALREAGLAVRDVADLTGFPEMLDGRVKTLHPGVHGGILHRRSDPAHVAAVSEHGIAPIDMVVVNLYAFEKTAAREGVELAEMIENIDIGGPSMLRSAAKNFEDVAVVSDPAEYSALADELRANAGQLGWETRWRLARAAFATTAAYDSAIATTLETLPAGPAAAPEAEAAAALPPVLRVSAKLKSSLRYGENPHQAAALYTFPSPRAGVASARQLQGKELSYNNITDTDAAMELVAEFDPAASAAVAIIKHANPCGVALGADLKTAYERALQCDPVSAFGGIVALNRRLDAAAAREIVKIFTEVVIAPEADDDAIAVFKRRKDLRLLITGALPDPLAKGQVFKSVAGGFVVQTRDDARLTAADLKIVTRRQPTETEVRDMLFAFTVAKHVKSNAIVFAKDGQTAGVGAGQMNRRDSARIAAMRAAEAAEAAGLPQSLAVGSACASEAFFPFADGLIQAAEAGATSVIQPGGSIRDAEVIEAADAAGVAMAFTGVRVFRH
jgi:phosphoribosylaminoimidazolecarboxamide formyltransferase/IMP cyclohydrolase